MGRLVLFLPLAVSYISLVLQTSSAKWLQLGNGVAVDEGNSVGDHLSCDLECCQAKCNANPHCNSFAASSRNCYLKDKCIFSDTAFKRSAYKTYYRPCPDNGLIENTCGVWSSKVVDADFGGDLSVALNTFITWQNCVVQAKLEGQVSRKEILFAVYRPGNVEISVVQLSAQIQGLLSTLAYAMATGRIFVLDWPELFQSDQTDGGSQQNFEPLDKILQCNFQSLRDIFVLVRGNVMAEEGASYLCGSDPFFVGSSIKPKVVEFSQAMDFISYAFYNNAAISLLEPVFGTRSLAHNPLEALFSKLFQLTPNARLVLKAIQTNPQTETFGILFPNDNVVRDLGSDSDGILLDLSLELDAVLHCVNSSRYDDDSDNIVASDQQRQIIAIQSTGEVWRTESGESSDREMAFEPLLLMSKQLDEQDTNANAIQSTVMKIALLLACDDLMLGATNHDPSIPEFVGGLGLGSVAPVLWRPNHAAKHRQTVTCARLATPKARPIAGTSLNELPSCTNWFNTEKSEELLLHYAVE